ncbi:MAG: hypothetical protein IT258_24455, partial [Saprospiraceae bacterium]|nr:hypothetical protein [Saprospiraceae bacterium]
HFDEKNAELDGLKAGQAAALRLFDEVAQMDAKLKTLSENRDKASEEAKALEVRKANLAEQITANQKKAEGHESALTELGNWLKTNEVWASLPQDLQAITIYEGQLRENFQQQLKLKEAAKTLAEQSVKLKLEVGQLDAQLNELRANLVALTDSFEAAAPDSFTPNRQDLLEKLGHEIEVLGEHHQHFTQLNQLNADYRELVVQLSNLEHRLNELRREELWLDKALLTAYDEAAEWESLLEYRREVYNQQLLLANYEKDRANLKEGDPCPLCLSTHHPFRLHEVKPFVDEAKNDLLKVETIHKERHAQRSQLLKKHIEVNTQIQQLDEPENGEIAKQEARLMDLEQRISSLLPRFDGDDFGRSHGDWLVTKLGSFEEALAHKKALREQLNGLNKAIETQEIGARNLEGKLKDLRFAQQQSDISLAEKEAALADLATKFAEATTELNQLVGKFGYQFSMETARQMFTELRAKEGDFSQKKTEHDQHERQLELSKQAANQLKENQLEVQNKHEAIAKQLKVILTELEELRAKRIAALGEKDPIGERENLLNTIEATERTLNEARQAQTQANERLASTVAKLEGYGAQLSNGKKQLLDLENQVSSGLSKAGFETLGALRSAILPNEVAAKIEAVAEQLKLREVAVKQEKQQAEDALKIAQTEAVTNETEPVLMEQIAILELEMQVFQQSIGALNQQLKDNDARKQEGETILQQIENQRIEYNKWAAVHDLIGSHDGAKFRKFAQGLTLQKLVQLANVHLGNLYGRYVVTKRPGEDLELDIVDTYQADNVRSMMTLSGGESFLVSLALALGLSDLAGRNANIRSLFIDEGFGTLDDQTLDFAISTLENLQSQGKTIGIISHVKELKERIPTQVRVLKKGGGTSVVEVCLN